MSFSPATILFNALYLCVLLLASPWLLWRYLRWGKNRRGWLQKLFGMVPVRKSNGHCIWFHAVSVGEVLLLTPIVNRLRHSHPEFEIVISTTTETGFDLATKKFGEQCATDIFFFPMDFSWAIRQSLQRLRPDVIALTELEMWPNFIRVASGHQRNDGNELPIVVVNGRLSESSFRGYQRFKRFFRSTFRCLRLVMAQNEIYANRFRSLGCDASNVIVTGNVKYDQVETDRNNPRTHALANLIGLAGTNSAGNRSNRSDRTAVDIQSRGGDQLQPKIFLAGSTQLEEDLMAAHVFKSLAKSHPELRLILAPRHPERVPQLVSELNAIGLQADLRSNFGRATVPTSTGIRSRNQSDRQTVFIIDVIGELGAWWGVADAAYVGGSMGKREGQNMIEPAAYGTPVSFGSRTANFKATVDELLSAGAATVVQNQHELEDFVRRCLNDVQWADRIGTAAQQVVVGHQSASSEVVDQLAIQILGELAAIKEAA